MIHELKIMPEYFEAVADGTKCFELRKDDRGFAVGDKIVLNEWNGTEYTGRSVEKQISYILKNYTGLAEGYAILSLKD